MAYRGLSLQALSPRKQPGLYQPPAPLPMAPPEGAVLGGGNAAPPLPTLQPPNFAGVPKKPKKAQKWLQQMGLYNALQAQQQLQPQIAALTQQASTDRFSPDERSAFLAPRLQALDTGMSQARSALDADLTSRYGEGLSSEAVSQYANLGARGAQAGAQIRNQLFDSEQQRQEQARNLLIQVLTGQQQQGAGLASNIAQQRIAQQLQEAMMQDPGIWEQLLGLGGAGLGAWLGGGFGSLGGGRGGSIGGALGGMF